MKQNNGQSGGLNAGNALVVQDLHRVTESQPTAWRGATPDGAPVHIAYLFGWLTVEVAMASDSRPDRRSWVTVARFQPALLEVSEGEGGMGASRPDVVRRALIERAATREIRQSAEADMRAASARLGGDAGLLLDRGRLVIRDRQLSHWLDRHNRFIEQGGAGARNAGRIRIHVSFASEGRRYGRRSA